MNGITFPKHQTFAYRQSGMSLKSQLIQLTNEFGLVFARFGTAEYCEATLMVFRLGTKVDKDPGAPFVAFSPNCDIIECLYHSCGPGSHVTIQPMVASVWPRPSRLLGANKQTSK